ncbi:hypothetical protein [uncultured Fibrobacter sp.]|nr:hypothetical protein [uncultured Fibrobacter sp.]
MPKVGFTTLDVRYKKGRFKGSDFKNGELMAPFAFLGEWIL